MLANLLRNQNFLSIINLRGNSIGNKGFIHLCDVLSVNDTLLSLNMEKN